MYSLRSKVRENRRGVAPLALLLLFVLLLGLVPHSFGFSTDQAASLVIGQSLFTTGGFATTATGLHTPFGFAFDSGGNLWVADEANNRVLEYTTPFSSGEAASLVIGQSSFIANGGSTTATTLINPIGVAFDSGGNLWVADEGNNRVLEYTTPFSTGEAASLVIGQSLFTTQIIADTSTGLSHPAGVAFDSSGNLWVADQSNNRVLEYTTPFSTDEAASLVIGQSLFTTMVAATTATGLFTPFGIAFDSGHNLWVADEGNNRVLEYTTPISTDEAASLVIGQSLFTTGFFATTATGLRSPFSVAFDSGGNLWVADEVNNRVLEYTTPISTDEAASLVIGQSLFTTRVGATSATGLSGPVGVAFDSSHDLWVIDDINNRVLEYTSGVASTDTAVTCNPTTVDAGALPGSTTTCTATVTGESGSIAGETITWTQSGGTGSVTFSSSGTCSLQGSPGSCSVTVTGVTAGSPVVQAAYPGDSSNFLSSGTASLTVNPALVAGAITPSAPVIVSGQSVTLTANPSGGTTPYTYGWYSDGVCTAAIGGATSPTYSASAAGTYSYKVTDAATATACSAGDGVTVIPALTPPVLSATPSTIYFGQSSTISVTTPFSGGISPYTCQWVEVTPGGIVTNLGGSFSTAGGCTTVGTPSTSTGSLVAAGIWTLRLQVTDSESPPVSYIATTTVTVNTGFAPPTISPSPSTIDIGQSSTVSVTVPISGGPGPYTCQWVEVTPGGIVTNLGGSFSTAGGCTTVGTPSTSTGALATAGTWTIELQVTDSESPPVSYIATTTVTVIIPALTGPLLSATPSTIDSDQSSTVSVATPFSGGTSPYTCRWVEITPGGVSTTGSPFSTAGGCTTSGTPSTSTGFLIAIGTWTVELQVLDSESPPVAVTSSVSITVNSALGTPTVTPSSSSIVHGQPVGVQVSWAGGTSPYSINLYGSLSSTCTAGSPSAGTQAGQASSPYTFGGLTPSADTWYCATVTDSAGTPVTSGVSPAALVTVSSAGTTTTVSCSPSPVLVGQTSTCTATVSVSPPGSGVPTGLVTFTQSAGGHLTLGASCILSAGSCSVAATGSSIGSPTLTATYGGDANYIGSPGTSPLTVTLTPSRPSTLGGVPISVGATFTDQYGNTWAAPGGTIDGGTLSTYFFAGPQSTIPPPMLQGWGGVYGTYDGQQGWVITFY